LRLRSQTVPNVPAVQTVQVVESFEDPENGTDPDVLAQEIVEDLEAALNWVSYFRSVILCRQEVTVMKEQLTAVFQKVPEGYIAFVEELPGANAQGDTLDEARSNLQEAVQLVLEANRALVEETLRDKSVIREPLAQIS
jgi:predicted RNase H-like HicB family nuclease